LEICDSITVVTGGASGLGEAVVRCLAGQGAKVAIFDLAEERCQKLVAELGDKVIYATVNVIDEESVLKVLNEVEHKFGGIHILVNCAGIAVARKIFGKKGPAPLDDFNRSIQVNLVGVYNVIRLTVEKMVKNKPNGVGERGVIINTASVAAFEGQIGQAAYSASKGGIVSMILPLARELAAHGIRVMGIAPGVFETPMFDSLPESAKEALGKMTPFPPRLGRPSEFAALVQHIVQNPMLNGSTIRLDGAIRMQPK